MMSKTSVRFLFVFLLAIVANANVTSEARAEDPKRVIESVADYAISQIANGSSWSSRRSAARQIVTSRFDVRGAGRFALGSSAVAILAVDESLVEESSIFRKSSCCH